MHCFLARRHPAPFTEPFASPLELMTTIPMSPINVQYQAWMFDYCNRACRSPRQEVRPHYLQECATHTHMHMCAHTHTHCKTRSARADVCSSDCVLCRTRPHLRQRLAPTTRLPQVNMHDAHLRINLRCERQSCVVVYQHTSSNPPSCGLPPSHKRFCPSPCTTSLVSVGPQGSTPRPPTSGRENHPQCLATGSRPPHCMAR